MPLFRKNGLWWFSYRRKGITAYRSTFETERKRAQAYVRQLNLQAADPGEIHSFSEMTVQTAATRFLDLLIVSKGRNPGKRVRKSLRNEVLRVRRIIEFFGQDRPISDLLMPHLVGEFNFSLQYQMKPSSAKKGHWIPISHLPKLWRDARQAAGMPDLRMHDLRHTYASKLVRKGVPLLQVSRLLGHCSIGVTMRYAHLGVQDLDDYVGVLDYPIDGRTKPYSWQTKRAAQRQALAYEEQEKKNAKRRLTRQKKEAVPRRAVRAPQVSPERRGWRQ